MRNLSTTPTTPTHVDVSNEQDGEDNEEEDEDDSDYQIESDEIADSGSSAEDDDEDDEVSDEEEGIDHDAELLRRWPRHNPFVGRGPQHPVRMLNDVSGFEPSDVDFDGPSIPVEGSIAEGMTFATKRALTNAIKKFHIEKK